MKVRPVKYQEDVERYFNRFRDIGYDISEPNEVIIVERSGNDFYNPFSRTPVITSEDLSEDQSGLLEELIHMEQDRRRAPRTQLADNLVTWLHDATYDSDIDSRFLEPGLSLVAGCGLRFRGDEFLEVIDNLELDNLSDRELLSELYGLPEMSVLAYLEEQTPSSVTGIDSVGEMIAKCGSLAESGELISSRHPVGDRPVNSISAPENWETYRPHHRYLANEISKLVRIYHRGDFGNDEIAVQAVNAGFRYLEEENNPREGIDYILREYGDIEIQPEELI